MDLTPQLPLPAQAIVSLTAAPRGWQVGQVLQAVAQRSAAAGETLVVRVGNETLQLQLRFAVAAGETLALKVLSLQPQLTLAVAPRSAAVSPSPAATPAAASSPSPPMSSTPTGGTAAARVLLPVQEGGAHLLMLLSTASRQDGLPPPVRAAMMQLMQAMLPATQAGNAAMLRRAIRDSGILFEAKLARAVLTGKPPAGLEQDLKGLLLRLAASLPETRNHPQSQTAAATPTATSGAYRGVAGHPPPPPTKESLPLPQARAPEPPPMTREALLAALRQAVDGVTARIGLHQLIAAETQQGPEALRWLLELPLRAADGHHDLVHMLIERDPPRRGKDEEHRWTAVIALDLPELGPVSAHISLGGQGKTVSVWFKSSSATTVRQINDSLPRLSAALGGRDLAVIGLGCHREEPLSPTSASRSTAGEPSPILDTRA